MEDLELQLKTLLEENWSVKAEKALFHRNMRRVEGSLTQPNIIFRETTDVNKWNTENTGECLALITVTIKIQADSTSNEDVDKAKEIKHEMREEIYRLLKAVNEAEIDKPAGWEWAFVTRRINRDNFDIEPALLGEELNITIAYQR